METKGSVVLFLLLFSFLLLCLLNLIKVKRTRVPCFFPLIKTHHRFVRSLHFILAYTSLLSVSLK